MTAERSSRLRELFDQALERPAEERGSFLAEACSDDDALRVEVSSLLDAFEEAHGFLETSYRRDADATLKPLTTAEGRYQLLLLDLPLLDPGPGITQRYRPIEHERCLGRIRIDAEITLSLELIPASRCRAGQARLHAAARQRLQRVGIQVALVVAAFLHLAWVFFGEEMVVQAQFRRQGMGGGDPV